MEAKSDYWNLLPKGIGRFSFLLNRPVVGTKNGLHKSPFLGMSTEFSQHRQYSQGDDPRRIDWRVLGKSDRYYVKQFVEETNARATVLVDCSASMKYRGELSVMDGGQNLSKLDYAKRLAATVAYILVANGDSVGVVCQSDRITQETGYGSTPNHLHRLLKSLNQAKASGNGSPADVMEKMAARIPRRGLVILISDGLTSLEDLSRTFHFLNFKAHQIVLFHVMAREELTFPFKYSYQFHDLEVASKTLRVDPSEVRAKYLERLDEYLTRLKKVCSRAGVDYEGFCTDQPVLNSVTSFLAKRVQRSGGVS